MKTKDATRWFALSFIACALTAAIYSTTVFPWWGGLLAIALALFACVAIVVVLV